MNPSNLQKKSVSARLQQTPTLIKVRSLFRSYKFRYENK